MAARVSRVRGQYSDSSSLPSPRSHPSDAIGREACERCESDHCSGLTELRRGVVVRLQKYGHLLIACLSKQRGRAPQNASGQYLLSGGLLVCPTCGGHFEAFRSPWKPDGVDVCATRRRKPGVCSNTLALPMAATDETVLEMVEGEVLGTRFIEELIALVDKGDEDNATRLIAERDRLRREVSNLLDLAASGVSAETTAPKIREREHEIAKLDAQLRTPRPVRPEVERLRDSLHQRAARWKADLRAEPKVARLLLRRLVGPLTLWDATDLDAGWIEWKRRTPALLEGLAAIQVGTSPRGFEEGRQWQPATFLVGIAS